jgi:hypothetical protein
MKNNLKSKPFYDRFPNKTIDRTETIWMYNEFVKPGKHQYFVIFKLKDGTIKK